MSRAARTRISPNVAMQPRSCAPADIASRVTPGIAVLVIEASAVCVCAYRPTAFPAAASPAAMTGETGVSARSPYRPDRPAGAGRHRRARRSDRAGRGDRLRDDRRAQCRHRAHVPDRPRLLCRPSSQRAVRADRQPRHHPRRRAHRPGRLRFCGRGVRPRAYSADRPGRHPGQCRDRRQHDGRSRRLADTVIGEDTKIDNLVQIAHNVAHRAQLPDRGAGRHFRFGDHRRQCCDGRRRRNSRSSDHRRGRPACGAQRFHEQRSGWRDMGWLSGRAHVELDARQIATLRRITAERSKRGRGNG